jgi:hypothetical protein
VRVADSGIYVLRAPLKRASGELRFLLTKDLHGCRHIGQLPLSRHEASLRDDRSSLVGNGRVFQGWLLRSQTAIHNLTTSTRGAAPQPFGT